MINMDLFDLALEKRGLFVEGLQAADLQKSFAVDPLFFCPLYVRQGYSLRHQSTVKSLLTLKFVKIQGADHKFCYFFCLNFLWKMTGKRGFGGMKALFTVEFFSDLRSYWGVEWEFICVLFLEIFLKLFLGACFRWSFLRIWPSA